MFKSFRRGFAVLVVSILAVIAGASAASAQVGAAQPPSIVGKALPSRPADCSLNNADAMRAYESSLREDLASVRAQQADPANKSFATDLLRREKALMKALIVIAPFCANNGQSVSSVAPLFISDSLPSEPSDEATYAEYAKYSNQLTALKGRLLVFASNPQWAGIIKTKMNEVDEALAWATAQTKSLAPQTKKRR